MFVNCFSLHYIVTSLIVLRRYTLYNVVKTVVRRGSTPTVVRHVASVAAMNVATGSLVLSSTDVSGWMLHGDGSGSIGVRKRRTGLIAYQRQGALRRTCGDQCQ